MFTDFQQKLLVNNYNGSFYTKFHLKKHILFIINLNVDFCHLIKILLKLFKLN